MTKRYIKIFQTSIITSLVLTSSLNAMPHRLLSLISDGVTSTSRLGRHLPRYYSSHSSSSLDKTTRLNSTRQISSPKVTERETIKQAILKSARVEEEEASKITPKEVEKIVINIPSNCMHTFEKVGVPMPDSLYHAIADLRQNIISTSKHPSQLKGRDFEDAYFDVKHRWGDHLTQLNDEISSAVFFRHESEVTRSIHNISRVLISLQRDLCLN